MSKIEFDPFFYEYAETIKKADQYIHNILYWGEFFKRYTNKKPTVFISNDVLAVIARGSSRALKYNKSPEITTVCGYIVKTVIGTNVLSIGFDLLERSLR